MEYTKVNVHIEYPESGIEFSQLKKIFATFEEGCKLYSEPDSPYQEGRVLKVESGSIWLETILPIAIQVIPLFGKTLVKKLCGNRNKRKMQVEIADNERTIKIIVEE